MPCSSATSLITVRKVMMLSAVASASAYRRSISFWPGPPSWWLNSTEMPMFSSRLIAARRKSWPVPRGTWSKYPPSSTGSGSWPGCQPVLSR